MELRSVIYGWVIWWSIYICGCQSAPGSSRQQQAAATSVAQSGSQSVSSTLRLSTEIQADRRKKEWSFVRSSMDGQSGGLNTSVVASLHQAAAGSSNICCTICFIYILAHPLFGWRITHNRRQLAMNAGQSMW